MKVTHFERSVHYKNTDVAYVGQLPFMEYHAPEADFDEGIDIQTARILIEKWNRMGKYPEVTYTYKLTLEDLLKEQEEKEALLRVKQVYKIDDIDFPISLGQYGNGKFRVVYGLQIKDNLTYGAAAKALGESILHALACAGEIDNQEI